jgi:DNA-binding beta-propeller fold protein YncE
MWRPSLLTIALLVIWGAAALTVASAQPPAKAAQPAYSRTSSQAGTRVELTIEHLNPAKIAEPRFEEGEGVRVRFRLTELSTGEPVRNASPAAWMDFTNPNKKTTPEACMAKVKLFAEGSTFSRTELDLTAHYVLSMNADATITVVDPRFGFGDSHLLALIQLASPAGDWALDDDAGHLFVSMPKAGRIAVIDTASWIVAAEIPIGPGLGRLALQPDAGYLWAGFDADDEASGVAVIGTRDLKIVKRMVTGRGYHHVAFTEDSASAFVTNPKSGTISIVDVRQLAKVADIRTGGTPGWIAYSKLARAAYAASEQDGAIVAVRAGESEVLARIPATAGLGQIRVTPDGRFALAVNPKDDRIYVVDTSVNRIVQTGKLDHGPDQITFTTKMAYVREQSSDAVVMIPLDSLGAEGKPVSVGDFPGGQHSPGQTGSPTPADSIVQASGEEGVLVANPGDRAIYFYMEGMAAPTGNFSNYGREPRAVLVAERNLRERAPGIYETTVKLTRGGDYDLAFLLDRPRIIECFDVAVAPDPQRVAASLPNLRIERLAAPRNPVAGETVSLHFRLVDSGTQKPRTDVNDLMALIVSPGLWQDRQPARNAGGGTYAVDFRPPAAGPYNVYLGSASFGLEYSLNAAVEVTAGSN